MKVTSSHLILQHDISSQVMCLSCSGYYTICLIYHSFAAASMYVIVIPDMFIE